MAKGTLSKPKLCIAWTEARCLLLIQTVLMVKLNLRRAGKEDTMSVKMVWQEIVNQLPSAVVGKLPRDQLRERCRRQFDKLTLQYTSKRRCTSRRNFIAPFSVEAFNTLKEYDRLFPLRRSQKVMSQVYVGTSRDSRDVHGESKSQESQSLSDEEGSREVHSLIYVSDSENEENSRDNDNERSLENLPEDTEPGNHENVQRDEPSLEYLPEDTERGSGKNMQRKSDPALDWRQSSGSTIPSTKDDFEHHGLNQKEKLLEGVHEEFSELNRWWKHELVPIGIRFVHKAADEWFRDNKPERSTRPCNHPYKKAVADCLLQRFSSKVQIRLQDFRLDVAELFYRITEEICRDVLEA